MNVTFGDEYQNLFKEVASKVKQKNSLFQRYSRTSLDDYSQLQSKEFFHKYQSGSPQEAIDYNRTIKPSRYVLYGQKKYKSMQMTFVNYKNARYQIRKDSDQNQNETDDKNQVKSCRSSKNQKTKCNINQIVFPFLSVRKSSKNKQKKAANISDFVQQNLNVSNSNRKNSRIGGAISNIVKFTKEEIDAYNKKFNFDKKEEYLQKLANLNQNVFTKEKLAESITVNNKKLNKPIYPIVQNLKNDSHNFKIEAWKPQPTELDDIPNIT